MNRPLVKRITLALLVIFVLLQFIRPKKNNGNAESDKDFTHYVQVPDTVKSLLKTACYDCHSNKTNYPWYSQISPASLWLANHIKEGKAELNFSEFSQYTRRRMKSKMSSIAEQVENREMPLKSYLIIHKNAELSDAQIRLIVSWTDSVKTELSRKAL
ncbi:heme-binding domain-containing protein [Paracnuella aquatica]|uniref:heme-binding domain-containing protein n=1 Tax=Paracnuella aquatica TaxID=2268757 RepID=UPI000DEF494C|nr:heme-binding domain-containing protein [Paracnuella aquatica]RPD43466.1 cytochrome C [Paracnuella aquatica]